MGARDAYRLQITRKCKNTQWSCISDNMIQKCGFKQKMVILNNTRAFPEIPRLCVGMKVSTKLVLKLVFFFIFFSYIWLIKVWSIWSKRSCPAIQCPVYNLNWTAYWTHMTGQKTLTWERNVKQKRQKGWSVRILIGNVACSL